MIDDIVPGMVFGHWEVIRMEMSKKKHRYYRCVCRGSHCGGKEALVQRSRLRDGSSTMCRTCAQRRNRESKSIPSTSIRPGDRFGHWVVMELGREGAKRAYWCTCTGASCDGARVLVLASSLASGKSRMCRACGRASIRGRASKKRIEIQSGTVFGRWVVLSISSSTSDERKQLSYACRCEGCGQVFDVRGSVLRSGKSLSCRSCTRPRFKIDGKPIRLEDIATSDVGINTIRSRLRIEGVKAGEEIPLRVLSTKWTPPQGGRDGDRR